jgi:cell wall-associated NlpC family hydrolase
MDVRLPAATALALLALAAPAAAATPTTGGATYAPTTTTKKKAPSTTATRAQAPTDPTVTGGTTTTPTAPVVADPATAVATLVGDGTAAAPAGAPQQVVDLIAAANRIATLPYRYGGGHGSFDDKAYDCSGSVSFALHGAGLLDTTLDSTSLMTWGRSGPGQWITVYANKEHTFLVVAGLRFDTSGQKATGSRWQPLDRTLKGFVVRHPDGL